MSANKDFKSHTETISVKHNKYDPISKTKHYGYHESNPNTLKTLVGKTHTHSTVLMGKKNYKKNKKNKKKQKIKKKIKKKLKAIKKYSKQ